MTPLPLPLPASSPAGPTEDVTTTTTTTTMTASTANIETATSATRKRPRPDATETEAATETESETATEVSKLSPASPGKTPPPYGSQAYWEDRYQRLQRPQQQQQQQQQPDNERGDNNKEKDKNGVTSDPAADSVVAAPEPFHAWYFNFEELAPIIMPLILGEGEEKADDDNDNDNDNDDDDDGAQDAKAEGAGENGKPQQAVMEEEEDKVEQTVATENGKGEKQVSKEKIASNGNSNGQGLPTTEALKVKENVEEQPEMENGNGNGNDDDSEREDEDEEEMEYEEYIEEEDDDDDSNSAPKRIGLANQGPISILEVGCGDVPLGTDLIQYVTELEKSHILKRVVCIDYSPAVIQTMQQQQQQSKDKDGKRDAVELVYEVADARSMEYKDQAFELVLDKGTLDAMLSDSDVGVSNCRAIVAECARVLRVGGYLVLISHMNAHVDSGLEWLDNIVVPGLRLNTSNDKRAAGDDEEYYHDWNVEVHGNAADIPEEDSSDDEDNGEEKDPVNPGPAVYIMQKGPKRQIMKRDGAKKEPTSTTSDYENKGLPTIPVKFFTY